MKRVKHVILSIGGALLVAAVLLELAKLRWDSHFYDGYDHAAPLHVVIAKEGKRGGYLRTKLYFDGLPGQRVPTLLARPRNGAGPFPCIIFLHGIGQDKSFLDRIAPMFTDAGFAIASFDQYTRGERKIPGLGLVRGVLALRRRAALTVIETRRLVDYLQTRPDIAPKRIYLLGASFGAITGATAAAFEPRIRAVVLTYGGGDIAKLLDSKQAFKEVGDWIVVLKYVGAYLFAPADPIRYVKEISPRPILFQNGKDDTIVPPASARALFQAAGQPKTATWYPGDHIGTNPSTVKEALNEAIRWLKKQDAALAHKSSPAKR